MLLTKKDGKELPEMQKDAHCRGESIYMLGTKQMILDSPPAIPTKRHMLIHRPETWKQK